MNYTVSFSPEALEHLVSLSHYIAASSPRNAAKFTSDIVDYCLTFEAFPHRGSNRDDIRLGMRTTNYKKRTIIAFAIDDKLAQVAIIGVYYGGQDYETILQDD